MDVKGTELKIMSKYVREKLGEDGHQQWVRSLPEETQKFYSRAIMASMWYPVDTGYMPSFERLLDLVSPDDRVAGARNFGAWTAREQLSGIYRVFLKVGSPNKMVSIAAMMWTRFYNQGTLKVLLNEPGHAQLSLSDVPVRHEPWENTTAGWAEVAVVMSGGRDPVATLPHSLARGDEDTVYDVAWNQGGAA